MKKLIIFLALFTLSSPLFADEIKLKKESEEEWKVFLEAGTQFTNGNSKTHSVNSKGEFSYEKNRWTNIIRGRTENRKDNNIRSKEEYYANNQTRYNFTKKNYAFGEIEYDNDRFAGYKYRLSEIVGYGRNILDEDDLDFSIRYGAGLRQNKNNNENRKDNWIVRLGSDFSWEIKEDITFKEILNLSQDDDRFTLESDASLQLMLANNLYLRLSWIIERQSSTSPNINNTDSKTMITLGYNFSSK